MSLNDFNNKYEKNNSKKKLSELNERTKSSYNNSLYNSKKNNNLNTSDSNDEIEEDKFQDEKFNESREKQLQILNEKFTRLYDSEDKIYENIIKEIDVEKDLIYKGSIMSFNLLILKIKCLMKLLKEKFEKNLNSKEQRNYYETDLYIQKIKNEFKRIYNIIDEDNKFQYEIITQNYCKFLFLMSVICSKKEEHIRSFSYVSLGVNMLKVFFVRRKVASDIDTYKIYAKLLIMLINKLISDNNIHQCLIYINILSKICEVALIIVYKNKLDLIYEFKFNKYQGYNLLFLGYCYEVNNNNNQNNYQISAKAYRESYYFMYKSTTHTIFSRYKMIITLEKKDIYLSQLLNEKLREKLIFDAMEKQRKYELQEELKKQLLEEAKTREKKHRLKLIASGFTPDPPYLVKAQNRIYNEILTPSNQKLMDKLDNELISYAYKGNPNPNNKDKIDSVNTKKKFENSKSSSQKFRNEKRLPSVNVMKNLCHFKMYNSLMSNDFREFILKNKKLEFNNPLKQKNSLDKIQKFLNRKMEIDLNAKIINESKEKIKEENENKENKKEKDIYTHSNSRRGMRFKTQVNFNSISYKGLNIINFKNDNPKKVLKYKLFDLNDDESFEEPNPLNYVKLIKNYPTSKNRLLTNSNDRKRTFIISKDKDKNTFDEKDNKKMKKKCGTSLYYTTSTNSEVVNKKKKKYKIKSTNSKTVINTNKSSDIINRKLDKYVFSRRYFKEVEYFENLTNKELDFQKIFLGTKNNNSKMYFKGFDTELKNNGKISKDEIYKSFLILHNKATYKERNYEKEVKSEMEYKNKPRVLGNVFKSVNNKTIEGKEVKSAMRKVLDRYIKEERKKTIRKNQNIISIDEINQKNEYSILKLNDNIKLINYLLSSKNKEAKNYNKHSDFLKEHDI